MVWAVPGRDRVPRVHLPAGSAVARAVGEGPGGRGAGGEGVPREPGDAGGGGPRPRADGVLAEVVVSLVPTQPAQCRPGRLAASPQEPADQPVLIGQGAAGGARGGPG